MSEKKEEDKGGCFSALFTLLVIGGLIYWGYSELKDTDFVQKIIKSDTELIVGRWKVVGGKSYLNGKSQRVKIQSSGDNTLFGTKENPVYFIFTNENEFIRTNSKGEKLFYNFKIADDKIITEYQEIEIIELTSKKLTFKEELKITFFDERDKNKVGKWYYTFETIKVKDEIKTNITSKKEKVKETKLKEEKDTNTNEFKTEKNISSEITTMKMTGKLRINDSPVSQVIKLIPSNATVRVLENKGDYWKIFYDGKTGYLNEMYLKITYEMSLMEK